MAKYAAPVNPNRLQNAPAVWNAATSGNPSPVVAPATLTPTASPAKKTFRGLFSAVDYQPSEIIVVAEALLEFFKCGRLIVDRTDLFFIGAMVAKVRRTIEPRLPIIQILLLFACFLCLILFFSSFAILRILLHLSY